MTISYFDDQPSDSGPTGGDANLATSPRDPAGARKPSERRVRTSMGAAMEVPGKVYVALEVICVALGLAAIASGQALFTLAGYALTGMVLPALWAGFYVRQKSLTMRGHATDSPALSRANQALLIMGLVVALVCVFLAATAWAKG